MNMAFTCSGCGMYGFGGGGFFGVIIWLLIVFALMAFVLWMLKQIKRK